MKRRAPFLWSLAFCLPMVVRAAGPEVLRTFKVGGEGRWDYVALDPAGGRLYVPRSTRVMVLDLEGRVKGEIPGTAGVHGVAFSAELDRGWTSNGQSGTVTVFKLSTLEVQKVVKTTGENPDAILFEPATKRVFTFNGRGKNATVFDALSADVVGTIPMGGKPEFAACDGAGRVYVNNEDTSEILAINARTLKVEAKWSIKPVEEPSGVGLAFPLIAFSSLDFRLNVKLRKFQDCGYIEDLRMYKDNNYQGEVDLDNFLENNRWSLNMSLLVDYIFLDVQERKKFAQSGHEYLIDQVQYLKIDNITKNHLQVELDFKHPCKELIWILQKDCYTENRNGFMKCRWDNYTWCPENTGLSLESVSLDFNGYSRFDRFSGGFFNYLQSYEASYKLPNGWRLCI